MNFKTKYLWWPAPMYRTLPDKDGHVGRLEHIGYRWLVREQLIKNVNLGWIATLDGEPYTTKCPTCGKAGYQP